VSDALVKLCEQALRDSSAQGEQRYAVRAQRLADALLPAVTSWDWLMGILAEHYSPEVFDGTSRDPGPQIVALTRALNEVSELLGYLLRQYDRVVGMHEQIVMDTEKDQDLHARSVEAFRLGARPVREFIAKLSAVSGSHLAADTTPDGT
jgi:hypothetical protein